MGVSFQDQHPQDAGAFCRPHDMDSRLHPTCPPAVWWAGTKDIGCNQDDILWGCCQRNFMFGAVPQSPGKWLMSGLLKVGQKETPMPRAVGRISDLFYKLFLGHNTRSCFKTASHSVHRRLMFYFKLALTVLIIRISKGHIWVKGGPF